MKVLKIMLGAALVPVLLMGGCAARAWQRDEEAKRFCLSMIPKIEEVRAQRGGLYPSQADPAWRAGETVPSLIHSQRFYVNRGSRFGFWFQNDGWVFDNVWEFDSGSRIPVGTDVHHQHLRNPGIGYLVRVIGDTQALISAGECHPDWGKKRMAALQKMLEAKESKFQKKRAGK